MTPSGTHETTVAAAFDGQAAAFEHAPIQTDGRLLSRLVRFADIPTGGHVLDAGCGPGLLAEAFLDDGANYRVLGCDLSGEMVRRAEGRCERFADRKEFVRGALGELSFGCLFEGAVTRLVLHHVVAPLTFVRAMVGAVRPGGVVVLADHIADTDPRLAEWHQRVEIMRDMSHVANLSGRALLDLAANAGLDDLSYEEHPIATDFDEWFSRGTPSVSRDECLRTLLSPEGRNSRAWRCRPLPAENASMAGVMAFVRGRVPG
jgi:SAM-dependent methyltransferase